MVTQGMATLPKISALYIYPIKSCGGIELQGVRFDDRGPQLDRRFMVIDADGQMVTQRTAPRLALVKPSLAPTALSLTGPPGPLKVPLSGGEVGRTSAVVWNHETQADDLGDGPAAWFSALLEQPVRLVRWAEEMPRPVSKRHTDLDAQTAFSDGYPVLLLSEASLTDLNGRLASPVTMDRFRPNIVVSGCEPYAEDDFGRFQAGMMTFDAVKPCSRCAITTVDQRTADKGQEPLATLASYRTRDRKVVFGVNCVHHGWGMLRVGDSITLSSPQAAP